MDKIKKQRLDAMLESALALIEKYKNDDTYRQSLIESLEAIVERCWAVIDDRC